MTKSFYYIIFCAIFSSLSASQQTKKRARSPQVQAEILNGLKSGPCSISVLLQNMNLKNSDYTRIHKQLNSLKSKGLVNFEHVGRKLLVMLAQESVQENFSMVEGSELTSSTSTRDANSYNRDALLSPPIQPEEYDYLSQLPLETNNLPLAVQNLEGLF